MKTSKFFIATQKEVPAEAEIVSHRLMLRASGHPEFDAWRWHDYWVPLETVIDFKREVYRQALIELHRYLSDRRARPRRLEPAHP